MRSLADLMSEIDDLKDDNARLRNALSPFAEMASVYPKAGDNVRLLSAYGGKEILVADLRAAAQVMRDRVRSLP